MNIGIIGAGNIGSTLGKCWKDAGHAIVYGVRDPAVERYRALAGENSVLGIADAIGSADVVLLATPGNALAGLLAANADALDGALVIDASNQIPGEAFHQLPLFADLTPGARVYRAFNTLGWENFADPVIEGERPDLFYSGPEGADRTTIEALIADVGLRPVYVGEGANAADILDGVARLWFTLMRREGHRHLAFRTLGLDPLQD
ncbi:MAG TPA: NAD(P)-binding domain-containing protein [Chloroflexota bacterium]|nr:NAD(P)-binding domain-containing protein [Chloroflexota bacterium]